MADIKNFDFAVKRNDKVKVAGKFTIGGDQEFTVRVLQDSNIAYLIAKVNSDAEPTKVITSVLDFMERAMPPESAKRFEKLVLDPEGGLSISQVMDVFQHVLGLVAGGEDPPGRSPGSASRPRKTGVPSRATTVAARGAVTR